MAPHILPFRDINLHASSSHYAFTSPSSPDSPSLVVERPTGDLRLNDAALSGAKRISSIAGILGVIKLKLGQSCAVICSSHTDCSRQVPYRNHKSSARGKVARSHGL